MSLATFKKKTINRYSSATKRSGKPPGGYWLPQGPFGLPDTVNSVILADAIKHYGAVGFSIQGGHRGISVGKTMKFSQQGTRFRGVHPMGHGGHGGQYYQAQPLLNAGPAIVEVRGNQQDFIKPSVLSNKGMLAKRFRWIASGQYPNNWVQPVYTGNLTDTNSQGLYVQNLASANTCNLKVNNVDTYEGYRVSSGPTLCTPGRSTAMFKFNDMARNAPYTKTLYQPVSYGQYNLYITRGCNNPVGTQKPFPYAVQTGTGIKTGGIRMTSVGNACGTSNIYLTPPAWYTSV